MRAVERSHRDAPRRSDSISFGMRRVLSPARPSLRVSQMLLTAKYPHSVLWASDAWLSTLGFDRSEILGKTLTEVIQGPASDAMSIDLLMSYVRLLHSSHLTLVSNSKDGRPFVHKLLVDPLQDSNGRVQAWQAVSSDLHFLDFSKKAPARTAANEAAVEHDRVNTYLKAAPSGLNLSEMIDICDL